MRKLFSTWESGISMRQRASEYRTACPNCHERYVNVVRHLKRNARCHRAVDEGRVLVRDFLKVNMDETVSSSS